MVLLSFAYPFVGIVMFLIYMATNAKKTVKMKKSYAIIFAMGFAAFGYCLALPYETDLTRYFAQVRLFAQQDLFTILLNDNQYLYTRDLLFYFVGQTGNVHLLPFFVGLIIYGIAFYVLFDMVNRSQRAFTVLEILMIGTIMVGVIPAFSVIGNVRNVLAYVLIAFAAYREFIQHKKNVFTILLYIVPLGLHSAAMIPLLLRVFQFAFKAIGKFAVIGALAVPALIGLVYGWVSKLGRGNFITSLLYDVFNKAYYYLNWTEGGWATKVQNSLSDKVTRIYGAFFIISVFIMIYKLNQPKNKMLLEDSMVSLLYSVGICGLGCLAITTGAFWRFEALFVLFCPVYLVKMLETNRPIAKQFLHFLFFTVMGMVAVNTVYHFRNVDMAETMRSFILFSGLQPVFDILF